jgi:hypothetical protein
MKEIQLNQEEAHTVEKRSEDKIVVQISVTNRSPSIGSGLEEREMIHSVNEND